MDRALAWLLTLKKAERRIVWCKAHHSEKTAREDGRWTPRRGYTLKQVVCVKG